MAALITTPRLLSIGGEVAVDDACAGLAGGDARDDVARDPPAVRIRARADEDLQDRGHDRGNRAYWGGRRRE